MPTNSQIKPSGVADLLIVRQQIKRYEAGEIANITNILKGERNRSLVSQTKTTELTTTTETEQTDEEQRDLQTTEHFDLKNEIDKTLKEDASLKAGVSVSGSYGGMIDFKTYVDGAVSQSQEQSTKHADEYSKDVTSRAASKVTTRTLQRVTQQVTEQFLQENRHTFDNIGGTEHVVGIYQWVDKIYEAQVFNYGKRLLYDFMVPEPGAFFTDVLTNAVQDGAGLKKPDDFTVSPNDITDQPGVAGNYYDLVAKYGVTGVQPPPSSYQTVTKTYNEQTDKDNHVKTKSQEGVQIPAGYRAMSATVMVDGATRDGNDYDGDPSLHVMVGGTYMDPYSQSTIGLGADVEGTLSVGLFAYKFTDYTVTIDVLCKVTDGKMMEWRLATHAAITQAYTKLLADYNDKLAALKAFSSSMQGHDPALNVLIVKNELKRSVMALLTDRMYESFNAIDPSTSPPDQPNTWEVPYEGPIIRFFEQAFEWDQILYVFYPYFWARNSKWADYLKADDPDSQFADFLKAGWARVTLPVRPWFEVAVAHYLETGEVWDGGTIPPINSPLYVSILTEIEERLQKPGEEQPQGTPWEVRLPTQLVRVRHGQEFPRWKKDQQSGQWTPQYLDALGNWAPET